MLSIILFIVVIAHGQNQFNIVDENTKWSVITDYGGYYDTHFIRFGSGDTIIEEIAYKKVYSTYSPLELNWTFMDIFIREDTLSREVYLRNAIGEEYMIYDFSLELGDTVNIRNIFSGPLIRMRVISIDTVLIYDSYRKRFQFEPVNWPYWDTWIEGIGSIGQGIIYSGYYNTSPWYTLLCYKQNDLLYYMNPDYTACYYPYVSVEEIYAENEIRIFPNPATDYITLNVNKGQQIEQIIIYDHLGQKVLEANQVNNTVDVSGLKSGMYLIEVSTKEFTGRQKLIKQ
jgi:hypothetical protein